MKLQWKEEEPLDPGVSDAEYTAQSGVFFCTITHSFADECDSDTGELFSLDPETDELSPLAHGEEKLLWVYRIYFSPPTGHSSFLRGTVDGALDIAERVMLTAESALSHWLLEYSKTLAPPPDQDGDTRDEPPWSWADFG